MQFKWFFSLAVITLFLGLGGCAGVASGMHFSADFESGSLPTAKPLDRHGLSWELALRDDNDNPNLPNSFRTWWYFRADQVPIGQNLHFEFSRLGFPYYFVPMYSYDRINWQYFDENNVSLMPGCNVNEPETCRLIVNTQFAQPTVWIARTFPYTTQHFAAFWESVSSNPYVELKQLGASPYFQKPLQLITIADRSDFSAKKTVWIHARTHPAETGPSFVLEGLIRTVLANDELGSALRRHYIFKIMPMHNVDGIVLGNYRTNASSINLENQWLFTLEGLPELTDSAPAENRLINKGGMVPALWNPSEPIVLAVNLHSSNSTPDTGAFFFPHFGSGSNYSEPEQQLWNKQLTFIKAMARNFDGRIEQPPLDGGTGFLNSYFPETWWWMTKGEAVNAITLETTYGRAGLDHWVTQDDLRSLGVALAKTINDMSTIRTFELPAAEDMSMFRLPFKPEIYQKAPE